MEIDGHLLKFYMEIGFLAAQKGHFNEAETVFKGIAMARPQSAYPQIGLGCVAMGRGDINQAIDILKNAPKRELEEQELCSGFLGMALKISGNKDESDSILNQLVAEGKSKTAVEMAGKLLNNG